MSKIEAYIDELVEKFINNPLEYLEDHEALAYKVYNNYPDFNSSNRYQVEYISDTYKVDLIFTQVILPHFASFIKNESDLSFNNMMKGFIASKEYDGYPKNQLRLAKLLLEYLEEYLNLSWQPFEFSEW